MTLDRTKYIGSHDIAGIIPAKDGGFLEIDGAYVCAYEVWASKRGIGNAFEHSLVIDAGLALEPVILKWWWKEQKHFDRERYQLVEKNTLGDAVLINRGLYDFHLEQAIASIGDDWGIHLRAKSSPHCGCSPDALIWDTVEKRFVAGVDAKAVCNWGWKKYEDYADDGIPDNLKIQGDYMCAISGLETWYFPVYHKGNEHIHEFVHHAEPRAKRLLEAAENFWGEYVETGKEPSKDGIEYKDYSKIHERLHGIGDGEAEATQEDLDLAEEYAKAHAEEKAAKAHKDMIKVKARARMGEASKIRGAFKLSKSGAFSLDTKG